MVEVTYLKDFGTAKKGDKREMDESTAKPLSKAKIVSYKGETKAKEEPKQE